MQSPKQETGRTRSRTKPPRVTPREAAFGALFVLLPLLFVAGMTYWTVIFTADQYEAQDFVPVNATIISSESVSSHSSSSPNYELRVTYEYTVGGRTYSADTFRLGAVPTTNFWVNDQIRAFPAGSSRVAYVDPDDPTRAVLDNSFTLLDMFIPAILSVFYGLFAVVFVGAVHIVRFVTGEPPPFAGAQLISESPEVTRIRPHHSPPSFRAAGLGFLLLFGAVFLLFFIVIRFEDRAVVFPITLGIIASIVLVQWILLVWPWRRSAREITIDRREGIVEAPAQPGSSDRPRIAIADIAAITTKRRGHVAFAALATPAHTRADTVDLVRFKPGKTELARNFADDLAQMLEVPGVMPE